VRVEQLPWCVGRTGFTEPFEELVAYLAQITDKTAVTKLMGISWATVGDIVERVVARKLDGDRLDELEVIGVDEFSYRKRHRYVTVVVDHQQARIVWAAEGRSAKTLGSFFELLGDDRRSRILGATIDIAGGYIKAIRQWLPNAAIIFDRFHVQRLASDAVDEVRREEVRRQAGDGEKSRSIKKSRFALLKSPWNLTRRERDKLCDIQRTNKRLYRAYLLKETLAKALDYVQAGRAEKALNEWLSWAARSRLAPFKRVARTIRKHKEGILEYIRSRFTNAVVEGFNNRIRMVARRAFGYHSASALMAMMFLCCGGITLEPPLP
jgi:transposase